MKKKLNKSANKEIQQEPLIRDQEGDFITFDQLIRELVEGVSPEFIKALKEDMKNEK